MLKAIFFITMLAFLIPTVLLAGDADRYLIYSPTQDQPVVVDKITKLMWKQPEDWRDDWGVALGFCESLNYSGFDDWRLPNINELKSLVNYSRHSPASDFPFTDMEWVGVMWSSTTSHIDSVDSDFVLAWVIHMFSDGYDLGLPKNHCHQVMCVRTQVE